jgi:hypothetical protein
MEELKKSVKCSARKRYYAAKKNTAQLKNFFGAAMLVFYLENDATESGKESRHLRGKRRF